MTPITSGRMTIIPTLEKDGWALPGGKSTTSKYCATTASINYSKKQGKDLTTEQRKHHVKHGGYGYAKHEA